MTSKTFEEFGIITDGTERTTCPMCSPNRHKKYDKCLSLDLDRGLWFCHHCGWSGGLGGSDGERKEAERVFKKPHFVESQIKDSKVLEWFNTRNISERTVASFNIKSGPAWMHGENGGGQTNTIQFPFYLDGEVVNVKYRTGDKRFRQEKNARKCFFNFDGAMKSNSDCLIITEGEMDAMSLAEVGYTSAVSVPDGAPSPNTRNYTSKFDFLEGAEKLMDKFKWIVLAVDGDEPGKRLEEELIRRIGAGRCLQVHWPDGCKDANDVLVKKDSSMLRQVIDNATPFPVDGVLTVSDLWTAVFDRKHNPNPGGYDTGWENMRHETLNIELGQMTVVTGIPGHGKSTWVDALRINLYKNYGVPSAAFSPENWPADDHLSTLLQMYSGENFRVQEDETTAMYLEQLMNGLFFIQPERDEDMMTVDAILERARTMIFRYGVQILVIDPWNEIDHNQDRSEREDQYISKNLAKIRRFARMNNIHVFLIAHPRNLQKDKDGQYPVPTAYEIAGGAMWRNKADNIICVYRPDFTTSITEVHIQKIRFNRNGKVGIIPKFSFHVDSSTYHPNGYVL